MATSAAENGYEILYSWMDCKNLEGSCAGGPYIAGSDLTDETRCVSLIPQ